jgi:hypothetical protein
MARSRACGRLSVGAFALRCVDPFRGFREGLPMHRCAVCLCRVLLGLAGAGAGLPLLATSIAAPMVHTKAGVVAGVHDAAAGLDEFKGIPYAAPPMGELRWKPPQPVAGWSGVRKADHFGPRCMQRPLFGDMVFRSDGMSENCLYLNVWRPQRGGDGKLPVLVYFYGGGFVAGDGSEPRYDGASLARRGIITVTVNYRLDVFGFLALPALAQESPQHAAGNYGLLDQAAALRWIHRNIAVALVQRLDAAGDRRERFGAWQPQAASAGTSREGGRGIRAARRRAFAGGSARDGRRHAAQGLWRQGRGRLRPRHRRLLPAAIARGDLPGR